MDRDNTRQSRRGYLEINETIITTRARTGKILRWPLSNPHLRPIVLAVFSPPSYSDRNMLIIRIFHRQVRGLSRASCHIWANALIMHDDKIQIFSHTECDITILLRDGWTNNSTKIFIFIVDICESFHASPFTFSPQKMLHINMYALYKYIYIYKVMKCYATSVDGMMETR